MRKSADDSRKYQLTNMRFIKRLCCGSSSNSTRSKSDHRNEKAPSEPKSLEAARLPRPPSEFVTHLLENPNVPTQDLLEPFLDYELHLRRAYAQNDLRASDPGNLVPIFQNSLKGIKTRTIDREEYGEDRHLMRLPAESVRERDTPATVRDLREYKRYFGAFTHSVLRDLDWSNIVVAGSAALLPLLPHRKDVKMRIDASVEDPLETYFQRLAGSSDIDIFIHGLDGDAAIKKIAHIESVVRKNQRLAYGTGLTLRTENAITLISPRWPYRHVQIILRLYKSMEEILTGFDVDCACVLYTGGVVYSIPRGIAAIATRTNLIDLTRRSPSYENRLYKYRSHLFDAYWNELDRSKIDLQKCIRRKENPQLQGLARLISFENILQTYGDSYRRRRNMKTIDENGEPTHSGYAATEVPYGERFTAYKVRRYISLHSTEPYVFGTIDEVLHKGAESSKGGKDKLQGRVTFLKDDPGRQMIGSFNPVTEDDWTAMAYGDSL